MEDELIVVIFDNQKKAYEGCEALSDLDAEGSITLYANAMIAKDAGGSITIKRPADEGPLGTGVGLFVGGLIGLLGGPAGVAVGAVAGAAGGALYDFANIGVSEDFLADVGQQLKPGKLAVVAEVGEERTRLLDTRMEAIGATILRRELGEVLDSQIEKDIASLEAEIANLNAEYTGAEKEARACRLYGHPDEPKLLAKINAAKAKLKAAQDRAQAAAEVTKREMDAKTKALKEHIAKAKGEAKAKLETRIIEIQSDCERRADKLHQAWQLTREALAFP
jgi:uncharacterized membrane protein